VGKYRDILENIENIHFFIYSIFLIYTGWAKKNGPFSEVHNFFI